MTRTNGQALGPSPHPLGDSLLSLKIVRAKTSGNPRVGQKRDTGHSARKADHKKNVPTEPGSLLWRDPIAAKPVRITRRGNTLFPSNKTAPGGDLDVRPWPGSEDRAYLNCAQRSYLREKPYSRSAGGQRIW